MRARILICTFFTTVIGLADDWPAPQTRETFSPSRSYFVRVIPGSNWGETYGFRSSPKEPLAQAEFYVRQPDASYRRSGVITLVNPVAPVDSFVTNQGYLVTLDNWQKRGYGKVAVFYQPDGKLIRAYELSDLFSTSEVNSFSHSMSSIQWRGQAIYLNPDGRSLYLNIGKGIDLTFDTLSGAYQLCDGSRGHYACRQSNRQRVWRLFHAFDQPIR